ncbi:unnamed protein product, partial [Mesorhabditis belari]|uniref:C-type lectin domain-containing protein n=1 Tax=Mesorhabditis belari TaxID=2138241 RepID=A0AAF3EEK4_9BILA
MIRKLIFFLFICSALSADCQCPTKCPAEFNEYSPSRCLTIVRGPYSTYKDAVAKCKAIGGVVAKITSSQENDAVWKAMMAYGQKSGMWIGIEKKSDGSFVYADGTPITYTKWAPNYYPSTNPANTCAVMDPSSGLWLPVNCAESRAYICSVDLVQG